MIVLLDMDGVLVDFIGRFLELQGATSTRDKEHFLRNKRNYPLHNGYRDYLLVPEGRDEFLYQEEVYEKLTAREWETMEPFPWTVPLLELLRERFGDSAIWIYTSAGIPTTPFFREAAVGKARWLEKYIPWIEGRVIMTGAKEQLAKYTRDVLVIDDRDFVCDRFTAEGYPAILCPQWWNKYWPLLLVDGQYKWYDPRCVEPVIKHISDSLDAVLQAT